MLTFALTAAFGGCNNCDSVYELKNCQELEE